MASAVNLIIAGILFLITLIPSAILMSFVRRRWLAWTISGAIMALTAWFVMTVAIGLSTEYLGGPYMSDLLLLWPLPIALLVLVFLPSPTTRPEPNHCTCGYDLTGNASGVCPECGRRVESEPS